VDFVYVQVLHGTSPNVITKKICGSAADKILANNRDRRVLVVPVLRVMAGPRECVPGLVL
jgi:hypothetical protein